MNIVHNVNDKLPDVECGSYLAYAPKSFPKNSRWVVAEYYEDAKGFYSESGEYFMKDVTHWCELPKYTDAIPITTEELEKYGFINSDYGWDKAISPTHTLRIVKSNKWYYPHIYESPELSSENEQVVSLKMIMYIHELQNLYFVLNGEEMEHI